MSASPVPGIALAPLFDMELHVAAGGPSERLERAAGIDRLRRLVPLLVAAGWMPLVLLALAERSIGVPVEPLARDLSIHTRLLVALPLFPVAARVLDHASGAALDRVFAEGFVPPPSLARLRAHLVRVSEWGDAMLPEALLLALALFTGVAALAGWLPPAGAFHGVTASPLGPVRLWYGLVSLPLFQFFLGRTLYRWALWVAVLVGLARAGLRLVPGHADRRGGIDFLKLPTLAFWTVMLFALDCVPSAGWATRMLDAGEPLTRFQPMLFGLILVGVLVAFAPLVLFAPPLFVARLAALRRYGDLVTDYVRRFEARWLDRAVLSDLLGTPDVQALADLSASYRENVERMQVLLFTPRDWLGLVLAAALPLLPLVLLSSPAHEVLTRLVRLLAGGAL